MATSGRGSEKQRTDERARRAVGEFRKVQHTLTSFARVLTGRTDVSVEMHASSNGHTDGKKIYYRPSLALGDDRRHDISLCDRRDELGQQQCPACKAREQMMAAIYHEISHIAFDSFIEPGSAHVKDALKFVKDSATEKYAARTMRRIMAAGKLPQSYPELANAINPYFAGLLNGLEDVRINERMHEARPGTRAMMDGLILEVAVEGVDTKDGRKHWRDMHPNHQAGVACYCHASGYDIEGWFGEEVATAFKDDELVGLLTDVKHARDAHETFQQAFAVFMRLRELGFFQLKEEQEQDEAEKDEEQDQSDEGEDQGEPDDSSGSDAHDEGGQANEQSQSSDEDSSESSDPSTGDSDGEAESGSPEEDGEDEAVPSDDGSDSEPEDDGSTDDGESDEGSGDDEDDSSDSSDQPGEADSDDDGGASGGGVGTSPSEGDGDEDGDDEGEASETSEGNGGGDERADDLDGDDDGADSPGDDGDDDGTGDEGSDEVAGDDDASDVEAIGYQPDEAIDATDGPEPVHIEPDESAEEEIPSLVEVGLHQAEEEMSSVEESAVETAIVQGVYFEKPSTNIKGVNEWHFDNRAADAVGRSWHAWSSRHLPQSSKKAYGILMDPVPETALSPALMRMRLAFAANKRSHRNRNQRAGRIDARVLGKRGWSDDDRLFGKKVIPNRRDYFVLIGLDISGSTMGENLKLIKEAAMAQADLCARTGVKFAVYAHTGSPTSGDPFGADRDMNVDIYHIKSPDEMWDDKARERLAELGPSYANLDGHTLEFYRKVCDKQTETDKVILYYSDGAMPAENYHEELEILRREIRNCAQKGYALLGVGIRTDEPRKHGLPTVRVDSDADILKVVTQLERTLTA